MGMDGGEAGVHDAPGAHIENRRDADAAVAQPGACS